MPPSSSRGHHRHRGSILLSMTSEHVNGNPIRTASESHGLNDSGGTEYQWQSEQEPSRLGSGVISTGRVRLPVMHGAHHLGVASLTTKRSRRGEVDYRGSTAGKGNAAECPVIRRRSLQSRHNCRSMVSESEDVRQLTRFQRASLGALVSGVDPVRAAMYLQPKSRWRRPVARSRGRVT